MNPSKGSEGRGFNWCRIGVGLYAAHLFSIFSLAVSNGVLGLTLLSLPKAAPRPFIPLGRDARRWLQWLGLYVCLMVLATLFSYDPAVSAQRLSSIFNLTAPVLGLMLIRTELEARRIVKVIVVLGLLLSIAGLVQFSLGQDDLGNRIRGSLSHYMTFAGVLLLSDCLLIAWLIFGRGTKRWWAWLALATINLALLGSYTRNAWLGLLAAVTLLLWVKKPKLLLAYLPVGALLALFLPAPILQRVVSIVDLRDTSNYDRLCMATAGLHMIAERPLLGLGPEMVSSRYTIYRHPTAPRFSVPHLHNSFLDIAAERGLVSLFAFLALIFSSLRVALRRLKAEGGPAGPRGDLYLGVLAAVLAFCVAGFFEDNWADTEVQRVLLFVLILPFLPEALEGQEKEAPGPVV